MAWWILDATGSAAKMSCIMAPMIFMNMVPLPLLGPPGNRFERKKLIIRADLWRCALYEAGTRPAAAANDGSLAGWAWPGSRCYCCWCPGSRT
jgi:hypothetical protein